MPDKEPTITVPKNDPAPDYSREGHWDWVEQGTGKTYRTEAPPTPNNAQSSKGK